MISRTVLMALGACLLVLSGDYPAFAQNYPGKRPVRIIVAQGAGSATDIMARLIAVKLGERLGQQFFVENKPGAGGIIGAEQAAKAEADGYTLFLASISTHGVNPGLYKRLPYDPIKDFAPVSLAGTTGNVVVVNEKLPIHSIAELISYAKANTQKISYASPGLGSSQHLATELFAAMAGGIPMLHVPYRGTPPGLTGVMAGDVDWMMPAIPSGLAAIKSGRVRPLAVTTEKRSQEMPDLPSVADTLPGFAVTTWYGLVAPAKTPQAIIGQLNAGLREAMSTPEAEAALRNVGLDLELSTPEAFAGYIQTEISKWTAIAKASGITLE